MNPGAPYDCTPTATGEATNRVSLTIVDYDASSNTAPAHDVDIMLHYPKDYDRTVTASVVSGTASIFVYEMGQYTVEILSNTINGYSNSVFDKVTVSGAFTQKTINRYELNPFTITTPTIQAFDKNGGLFTYTITCHTNTPRRITFTVQTNATEGVQYWFTPVTETVNNGDTIKLTVFVPNYYQLPRAEYLTTGGLEFNISGTDTLNNKFFSKNIIINQNWRFYVTIPSVIGCVGGGGMGVPPYRGIKFNSISFDVNNFAEYGERIVDYENIEIYTGGRWYDNSYWGGIKKHTIDSQWAGGSTIEIPFVLPAWTTINWLRIIYDNCGYLPYDPNMAIRLTLKITWGNFVYRQLFQTSYWYY